mmetsp:Transcript_12140/g.32678  ORF Transcript_12140/g.32678 Transcript_12140/m.32678 type:complete len:207 (+) Transcript_12140:890-1510(+)
MPNVSASAFRCMLVSKEEEQSFALDSRANVALVIAFALIVVLMLGVIIGADLLQNAHGQAPLLNAEGRTLEEQIGHESNERRERKLLKLRAMNRVRLRLGHGAAPSDLNECCLHASQQSAACPIARVELHAECAICLELLLVRAFNPQGSASSSTDVTALSAEKSAQNAVRLSCNHLYHEGCIGRWAMQSGPAASSCPVCRSPILL